MRSREFLSKLEHDRIVHAIREGESKTSGEIRVYVQRGKLKADPLIVAQKKFQRLQMHKTQQRNVGRMRAHFQNEKFTHALVQAIQEIGKVLAAHFPKMSANANELPDEIA